MYEWEIVTTARPAIDGPSTLTPHTSDFPDVAGFPAKPLPVQHRVALLLKGSRCEEANIWM